MKSKTKISLIIIVLFGVVSLLGCSNEVYATGSSGGGSGGSACTKNCGKPRWWGVYPSGKHSGISWKVFKTKKKNEKPYIWKGYKLYRTGYDKGPIYCKTVSKQSKTSKCPTIGALSNYGYKKDLAENCPINKIPYRKIKMEFILLMFTSSHKKHKGTRKWHLFQIALRGT